MKHKIYMETLLGDNHNTSLVDSFLQAPTYRIPKSPLICKNQPAVDTNPLCFFVRTNLQETTIPYACLFCKWILHFNGQLCDLLYISYQSTQSHEPSAPFKPHIQNCNIPVLPIHSTFIQLDASFNPSF